MGIKSKGRGTAAAIGLLLVFAGIVGAIVLLVESERRPGRTIDGFARAPVGCTTRMEFADIGTFYVFEELGGAVAIPDGECVPTPDPAATFDVDITGPARVVVTPDDSLRYDDDDRLAVSVSRIEIVEPGRYAVSVDGNDPAVVAAVGRDPNDGVDDLRRQAIMVGVLGVVLGLALLLLAGWRSRRAATYATPDGPGWGPQRTTDRWVPEGPRAAQRPINPQQPDEPAHVADEPAPLPAREPAARSPWEPPGAGEAVEGSPPDPSPPPPPVPSPKPTLPHMPGRPSGVSPDAPEPGRDRDAS